MKASLIHLPLLHLSLLHLFLLLSLVICLSIGGNNVANTLNAASPNVQPISQRQRQAILAYDIVYIRQPRRGDNEHVVWPEVFHPGTVEPGSDLILLHPNGTEEILVDATNGAVTDPFVSFDGQWVYYAYFHDATQVNTQRGNTPISGADIYRIHLTTRQIQRLTHQEFTPNTGAGKWDVTNPVNAPENFDRLGYGILNLGPAPVSGGKIIFTSNRNGFVPTKGFSFPTLQLFVMDEDGSNVTPIAPMTIGSALHPTPLQDGRIAFSTYESEGMRDERLWGLWAIWPDGRYWEPMVSAFKGPDAFHFVTQLSGGGLSGGDLVVEDYYNLNNFSFGALYRFPLDPPAGQPRFHPADLSQNPPISQTIVFESGPQIYPRYMAFTPRGLHSITPLTNAEDQAAPLVNGQYQGKFTHPSAAPNNDLLVVWSPGPVNLLNRPVDLPAVDAGLYLIVQGQPVNNLSQLQLIKNDPAYNEVWPRAVVTYRAVHGVDQPKERPWLPNDGTAHTQLPAGTAYGLVGTSSFYRRESFPGHVSPGSDSFDGLDAFNTSQNEQSSNWFTQGADAGKYNNSDIWAVRLLAMEPNTHHSYGPHEGRHFFNHANEKLRILGEIPLRKFDSNGNPILDPEGNPDTSFLVKIPADTPFTFQLLDRNGMVLNMAQTWHQVRPGELRADCGGCHAHSMLPLSFEETAAAKPGYAVWDLSKFTPLLSQNASGEPTTRTVASALVNIEFYRDVRPILQRSCVGCHTGENPPGNLNLNDLALYNGPPNTGIRLPGDYARLCYDQEAQWGYAPVIGRAAGWRQTNASRYVRPFQSRRSLLLWKLFGQRLDGWNNEDHPTESTPGDANTLPAGAEANDADLDFTGSIMPPPGGATRLTIDEKMMVARWVDLGCPINTGTGDNTNFGWFLDDLRPTLEVSLPRSNANNVPLTNLRIAYADANSGVNPSTLSITATISINGRSVGAQLADLAQATGDGIFTIPLNPTLSNVNNAHLFVQVADQQGNLTQVDRKFSIGAGNTTSTPTPVFTPTPPIASPTGQAVFLPLTRR